MIGRLKALFSRNAEPAVPEPAGETVLMNVYSTLLEIAQPAFAHKLHSRRDLSDPALLKHLQGFCAHVLARGDGQMSREKYHVILHVQRVQQHLGIAVGIAGLEEFYAWAANANAILFTEDGNVIDPQGRVLVGAADGKADPDARLPYRVLIGDASGAARPRQLDRIVAAARHAQQVGLECHAGHGLTYDTVGPVAAIASIVELNIGHFLVGEAIFDGLESAIRRMRTLMDQARAGAGRGPA